MMREDILVNQFTERYETGAVSEGEIKGGAKFQGESSVLEKKEEWEREKKKGSAEGVY
jgi:hypothetical protein